MIPIPQEIQGGRPGRKTVFSNPMIWLLALLAIVHLGTFIPAILAQRQYVAKDHEFKELWNTGGSMSLAAQGIEPTRKEEAVRREAYMRTFVEGNFFYNTWMVPHWSSGLSFFTAWAFQPGWLSLFLAICVLLYLGLWVQPRWPGPLPALLVIGFAIAGTVAYYFLVWAVMGKHGELPYCGISVAAATGLGVLIRSHKGRIPIRYYWLDWKTILIHPYAFAGIWVALDFLVQAFINPMNYGWVFALDLLSIAIGYMLGSRLPSPKFSSKQTLRPLSQDPLAPIRKHLDEGWRLAEILELEAALVEMDNGLKMLLRNPKPDPVLVESSFEKILTSKNPMPITPQLWYEWGIKLAESNFHSKAIQCLESAVKTPGATTELARPAILQAAELRIRHNIEPSESIPWLQRVIKSRADDLIGRKANQLLESLSV